MRFHGWLYSAGLLWLICANQIAADPISPVTTSALGTQQNIQESSASIATLQKAAEQGDARSRFELATVYFHGRSVRQDYSEALKWFRKVADQGYAEAQYSLGLAYREGRGVTQNYAEAAKWYRRAADQGVADAQNSLGAMYLNGTGLTQDYVQAHMWLILSTARGLKGDAFLLSTIAPQMTPGQIAEAQQLAREWKPKAAK